MLYVFDEYNFLHITYIINLKIFKEIGRTFFSFSGKTIEYLNVNVHPGEFQFPHVLALI